MPSFIRRFLFSGEGEMLMVTYADMFLLCLVIIGVVDIVLRCVRKK